MLMILARLVRSESFWAVAKVRSPHTGPGIRYIILRAADAGERKAAAFVCAAQRSRGALHVGRVSAAGARGL